MMTFQTLVRAGAVVMALGLCAHAEEGAPGARVERSRKQDRKAIQSMAGCYKVTFRFSETFKTDKDYPITSKDYQESGLEWVDLDSASDDFIALQHVLWTPDGSLKHWRQEWTYEPTSLLVFQGRGTWKHQALSKQESRGTWGQRVLQVDDSPRYDCAAPWIHWGSNHYWECEAPAPLPRREFSQRSDYQIVGRRNRHQIVDNGWLHEQDNRKLALIDGQPTELAKEKGLDSYERVPDEQCATMREWWKGTRAYWHVIQGVWSDVYANPEGVKLKSVVNGKPLYQPLFDLVDQTYKVNSRVDFAKFRRNAEQIISLYLDVPAQP